MKYSFYPGTAVQKIPLDAEKIHLVRPVPLKKLKQLFKSRNIREITLSRSCLERLSEKTKKFLKEKNAMLEVDKRSGRALELGLEKILKINELKKDYLSLRKIASMTETPKSTVHYLLKYADRNKVRKGNQTIYLE